MDKLLVLNSQKLTEIKRKNFLAHSKLHNCKKRQSYGKNGREKRQVFSFEWFFSVNSSKS